MKTQKMSWTDEEHKFTDRRRDRLSAYKMSLDTRFTREINMGERHLFVFVTCNHVVLDSQATFLPNFDLRTFLITASQL